MKAAEWLGTFNISQKYGTGTKGPRAVMNPHKHYEHGAIAP